MAKPILLIADKNNNISDVKGFAACAMAGENIFALEEKDLIPMPCQTKIFFLPKRRPLGFDLRQKIFREIADYFPVAAFVPPGYTQLFTCAYKEEPGAEILPLFSYAPLVWYKSRFHVPAIRVDQRKVHDLSLVNMADVRRNIQKFRKTSNRLIMHLRTCALNSQCPNAINFFLGRYECPLPSSPHCNAGCFGCISFQEKGSCVSSQERISFMPTPEELAEIALLHIKNTRKAIVSFGQGCEGEPLLAGEVIDKAIRIIRSKTAKGTIHMNTNASLPRVVEKLCNSGLDSLRVSFNSLRKEFYNKYYRPIGYEFEDVIRSVMLAKNKGKFVSINYLTMPGFTDEVAEWQKLERFIRKTAVDMIQWRNLNYDPQRYFQELGHKRSGPRKLLGVKTIMGRLKKEFPKLLQGYFNISNGR
ncbi:MAG: radical SAM protein [Candidatus Omnitrophota bacterium]